MMFPKRETRLFYSPCFSFTNIDILHDVELFVDLLLAFVADAD